MTQKLEEDRLKPSEPFTYSAVDFFGPFHIKEGRSEKKKIGSSFHVHGQPGCAYRDGKLHVNGFIHQCLPTFCRPTWTRQTAAL